MTTQRRDAISTAEKQADRVRRVIVSDESVDRYNTTFAADGWETRNFEANPVLLWCHEASSLPLGKASVIRAGKKLLADCEFFTAEMNPDADRVLRMLDAGVLAVSHRFEPIEQEYNIDRETGDWRDYMYPPIDFTKQELLEVSIVTVPGNANALPLRAMTDAADLRLVAQAAMVRSLEQPQHHDVRALKAAALAKRAAPAAPATEPVVAPVPMPAPVPAPEPELPLDEQVVDIEGLDAAGVQQLVKEAVAEVIEQRGRSAELRRRGDLEVAEGAA